MLQESLFGNDGENNNQEQIPNIPGLKYLSNFLSKEEHNELWKAIEQEKWLDDLKRRVQHYGYKYDYRKRSIDESMRAAPMPAWVNFISKRLVETGIMETEPDQLIVNEYEPGQGIAAHIDCEPCFDDTVISISLGSPCNMEFINYKDKSDKHQLLLEVRSAVVLSGDARYKWLHGINANKSYKRENKRIPRERRISLTFRKVILNNEDLKVKQNKTISSKETLVVGLNNAISQKQTSKILSLCRSILETEYSKFVHKNNIPTKAIDPSLEEMAKTVSFYLEKALSGFNLDTYKLPRFVVHSVQQALSSKCDSSSFIYSKYLAQTTLLTCQILEDISAELERKGS